MKNNNQLQKQAKLLRIFRKIHRTTCAFLFINFLIISITGILLGWKKHSYGEILPKNYSGSSTVLKDWLPLDTLYKIASKTLNDSVSANLSTELERIDIRKNKGMLKFVFNDNYYEVQLDGATGKILQIKYRFSDLIENIHDGSILDKWFGTASEEIKLIYTSISGLALLTFTITGVWLWFGPKRMKKNKSA